MYVGKGGQHMLQFSLLASSLQTDADEAHAGYVLWRALVIREVLINIHTLHLQKNPLLSLSDVLYAQEWHQTFIKS